jgi:hypothetical protein
MYLFILNCFELETSETSFLIHVNVKFILQVAIRLYLVTNIVN